MYLLNTGIFARKKAVYLFNHLFFKNKRRGKGICECKKGEATKIDKLTEKLKVLYIQKHQN